MTLEITETPCGKVAPDNTSLLLSHKWPVVCLKPIGHEGHCQGRSGIWDVYWNSKTVLGAFAKI